jgi:23S rRNA pseudouridine1911/1915/1917 synthase
MNKSFSLTWNISDKDSKKTIKEFIKEQEISKAALTDIKFNGGKILINGQEMNVRYRLQKDDHLHIIFPLEIPSEGVIRESIPLEIIYEDDYLLVVNKPAFMNTIPSREHPIGSLAGALLSYYDKIGLSAATHIVTRLDRNTSGLVLVAKHRHVHHMLSQQQKSGLVKRTYIALVHGIVQDEYGTIEAPIGRKSDSIIEREVSSKGQFACTHYQLLQLYNGYSYIELRLETGRTHQIRVHMSHLGHPLLGDDLYGGDTSLICRQALHCKRIAFLHPFQKKMLAFEIANPCDIEKLIKADHL